MDRFGAHLVAAFGAGLHFVVHLANLGDTIYTIVPGAYCISDCAVAARSAPRRSAGVDGESVPQLP